ncbi:MAG: M23 family metallopeptidase [Dehalococcoidia bacterium]|jgi:hypothetical protein
MTIKLIVPVAGTILQTFGGSPEKYAQFGLIGHNGIDYGCPVGTPVHASAAGQVTKIQTEEGGYGLHIRIQHPNGTAPEDRTIYAHLSEVNVKLNQKVEQGEVVAKSGNSGFSTVPHVHFEYRPEPQQANGYNGAVDPTPYFSPLQPTETPTAGDPAPVEEIIDEQGKATVLGVLLNLRLDMDPTNDASVFCILTGGREIPYNAIIATKGGDNWLRVDLWGNTLYAAALVDGIRYVKFSG